MLTVRLQRVGRKNDPSFRMVVIDSKKGPKSRNYIEMVGSYNPRQKTVEIKADRVKHWIEQGAQTSDTVRNILINQKIIKGKKVNPLGKKTPIVKAAAETADDSKAAKPAEPEAVDNSEDDSKAKSTDVDSEKEASADAPATEEKKEEAPKEEPKTESEPEAAEKPKEENKKEGAA